MNSCLYECSVYHRRILPREHSFRYQLFYCYLDLDELDQVQVPRWLFGRNRRSLYGFRDDDHLPGDGADLKTRVLEFLSRNGIELEGGRVMLLTLPRVLGYVFNPVSFYFCFDASGTPRCAIAEVGNTFRELKAYLIPGPVGAGQARFRLLTPKHFYVSPFSDLSIDFEFQLSVPGEDLDIRVDDWEGGQKTLQSALTGRRAPFSFQHLAWLTLKYPLITAKVIFLIHAHALWLWWLRIPWHRKGDSPELQTNVLKPTLGGSQRSALPVAGSSKP
jgi:uncharacterized protein